MAFYGDKHGAMRRGKKKPVLETYISFSVQHYVHIVIHADPSQGAEVAEVLPWNKPLKAAGRWRKAVALICLISVRGPDIYVGVWGQI